jgi:hypothetical protein
VSVTLTLTAAVVPTDIRMSIIRAKTAIYYLEVERADGSDFDLTGTVLYFYASNGAFTISKSSLILGSPAVNQGIVFRDAASGLATLTIDPADTETLGSAGVFGMPCEFTLTGGSPAGTLELATGNLTISPNVGTP